MLRTKNVALVPARSGSKRVSNKNVKNFVGSPIISYPIKAAIESNLFDKIFVSTDSLAIADLAIKFGAEVIDLRPSELSNDSASTLDVIKYEILKIRDHGYQFEHLACIYPATPMLSKSLLQETLSMMKSNDFDFCFPVVKNHVGPERLFRIGTNGSIITSPKEEVIGVPQSVPNVYRDAGQFYWGRAEEWLTTNDIFTNKSLAIPIPEYLGIDIDTPDNWKHAELIYVALETLRGSNSENPNVT